MVLLNIEIVFAEFHILAFIYSLLFNNCFCQYPQGQNQSPCKHKQAVSKFHGVAEFSILPYNDANVRATYHYIATGETLDGTYFIDDLQKYDGCNS